MVKWKTQAVEPDTCEGAAQGKGCRYVEIWDVEADPLTRMHITAAVERTCAAHADTVPQGKMLWADGNWKPFKEYIEYQRAWFRHLNHKKWLIENPDEPMPPEIAGYADEPHTTGSVNAPSQAEIDALHRVAGWNRADNLKKNSMVELAKREGADPSWHFEGHGDSRVLRVGNAGARKQRIQDAVDIQFGPNKVVVE